MLRVQTYIQCAFVLGGNMADNTNIDFRTVRWGRADEYIDNLKLDERIEKLYG